MPTHQRLARRYSRRTVLRVGASLAAGAPLAAFLAACNSDASGEQTAGAPPGAGSSPNEVAPVATPTREPVVHPAGRQQRQLMQGTPQETPLYLIGSGRPGRVALVLGGVHGNEPGGWIAAERAIDELSPEAGAIAIVPRANRLAIAGFVRTTDDLGDLNRLYPGRLDGLPMERMAYEIVEAIRDLSVDVVVDMHESWGFYRDRPVNSTAYLGQTISTAAADDDALALASAVVEAVNQRVRSGTEEFSFREFPPRSSVPPAAGSSSTPQPGASGGSRSSLGLPRAVPGLLAFLVEMGQQQPLERRVQLHIDVLTEFLRRFGVVA